MSHLLIIGAGGVGRVVARKAAQSSTVFDAISMASRTPSKCQAIASEVSAPIATYGLDADDVSASTDLIRSVGADLVINVASPYQNLAIMQSCIEAGVHYIDTSADDDATQPKFTYADQWALDPAFKDQGKTALLSLGFDPGVVNVYCAYAQRHLFDQIHTIDIIDCNAGSHGRAFATNFDPETNLREVLAQGRYWDGGWKTTDPLAVSEVFEFPEVGPRRAHLMYHEEIESIVRFIPGVQTVRFWMTFSESYLEHLRILEGIGMTSIVPVDYEGAPVVPLRFLKTLLPDPAVMGEESTGQTCIGCLIEGEYQGRARKVMIYNVCDHATCYREVGSQAVSYTTGVPAVVGAELILKGAWAQSGVYCPEQLDPDPFMEAIGPAGLSWMIKER